MLTQFHNSRNGWIAHLKWIARAGFEVRLQKSQGSDFCLRPRGLTLIIPPPGPESLSPWRPPWSGSDRISWSNIFTTHGDGMGMVYGLGYTTYWKASFYGGDLYTAPWSNISWDFSMFFSYGYWYERDIYWALGNDGQFGTLIFCKTMGNLNSRLFENCWVSSDCPC